VSEKGEAVLRIIWCAVIAVLLAGCQREPKYAVWKVGGRPVERVQVEKGLDRAACELILQRLEKKYKDEVDLVASLNMQSARAGLKPDLQMPPLVRYSCEPEE
jgi:flagellar biosynthesis/type III secretory pathway M-ring protein FliF/YscJ